MTSPRPAAVLGGNRIPFARANGPYATESNQAMLTAAIDGLVARFSLQGEHVDEVVAGAVLKHARDFNLTRESVLGSALASTSPAYDIQQACDTGIEAAVLVANKIALGQIDVGIAGGTDTASDAPVGLNEDLRKVLMEARRAKTAGQRAKLIGKLRPGQIVPDIPRNAEPRTGLSMGEHAAITAKEWGIDARGPGRARRGQPPAPRRRLRPRLLRRPRHALRRASSATRTCAPTRRVEKLAKLKPVFGEGEGATMTAGNSTPLSDGAAVVLLASDEWATERSLPVLAHITHVQTAAVDYVDGDDGLLMAPVYAVPKLLEKAGLTLQDFDFYEIHEAFASQVLATLAAWEKNGLGTIDRAKLNVNGSSLAAGHPFAATGGRIVATLAKLLDEKGSGRGLISICAAGGQGVVAVMEK